MCKDFVVNLISPDIFHPTPANITNTFYLSHHSFILFPSRPQPPSLPTPRKPTTETTSTPTYALYSNHSPILLRPDFQCLSPRSSSHQHSHDPRPLTPQPRTPSISASYHQQSQLPSTANTPRTLTTSPFSTLLPPPSSPHPYPLTHNSTPPSGIPPSESHYLCLQLKIFNL